MSKLPKLKVKRPLWYGYPVEEIRDFEQAQYFLFSRGTFVVVEGQVVYCYDELVQLAAQDSYKDKEFLEVNLRYDMISGG